jgi:hypothetical protein
MENLSDEQFITNLEYKGHVARVVKTALGTYATGYDRYPFERRTLDALRRDFESYIDHMYRDQR